MNASSRLPDGVAVLERGWLSSNNVVFHDPEGVSVVDTGYLSHADQTLALLDEARQGRALVRIVNTHLHSDHVGGNAMLQRHHPDCRTVIPPGPREAVEAWDEVSLNYEAIGQRCERFRVDEVLVCGQTMTLGGLDWRVLPAAGHDADMVMLWCEREGLLISADALWQNGFGVIFPELSGEPGFQAQRDTLAVIAQLQPRLVIPGHGRPFTEVAAAVQAAQSRLQWFIDEPRRHADNALKGLVAFTLLERQRMHRDEVHDLIERLLLPLPGVAHLYPEEPEAVTAWVMAQLARVQAADLDDDVLSARR